jgi:glycosyltransferase involved in cell wall biosynthesis
LTVVTACYNRAACVGAAVESALAQDYPHVEHLVIDGASTDGSLDVLRRYGHLRVVSERDRGVYDAFNKGVRLARGEVIGLLNTDDVYEPNVFGEVMARFRADPSLMCVSGGARVVGGAGQTVMGWHRSDDCRLTVYNVLRRAPIINARFFRRAAHERVGAFDERYPLAADVDFLIRAAFLGLRDEALGRVVYVYRQHGGSLTINGDPHQTRARLERLDFAERFLKGGLPGKADRRLLALSHTEESLVLLAQAVREARLVDAARHSLRGWRYDRRWPLAFLTAVGRRLLGAPAPDLNRPPAGEGGQAC